MIYLNPRGGLCNRIRVIGSAVQLGKKYGDSIIIFWRKSPELGCTYEDLFEDIVYDCQEGKLLVKSTDSSEEEILMKVEDKIERKRVYLDTLADVQKFQEEYKAIGGAGEFFLSTCNNFGDSCNDFSWLLPKKALRDKIEQIVQSFGNYCIGIHIRRTDHWISKRFSCVELFVEAISEEILRNQDVKFYLATDDMEVRDFIINKFGTCIVVNEDGVSSRNSKAGMEAAVIDLFALSRTQKIYGSFWSSFSGMASKIGNVELERVCVGLAPELQNKKIVLYGAGEFGQVVYWLYHKDCNIVGWVDQNYSAISSAICKEILPPEKILELDFDYIVIAVKDNAARMEIEQILSDMGISLGKIVEDI